LGLHWIAAVFGALVLAFSPSFWSQANIQRVYSLNSLFVILATAMAFAWYGSRKTSYLGLAFLLCGLGASNHTFMAIYAAALFAFVLLSEPALIRRPRSLTLIPGGFTVGLLPYLYLPLISRSDPRLDWGDPETLSRLVDVVLRRDFWGRAWIEKPSDLVAIAADYLGGLVWELYGIGVVLAVLGVVVGRRRRWPIALPLLVMMANLLILALHGSRADIFIWHRYYIPSYMMGSLLAAMGLHALLMRTPSRLKWLPLAVPVVAIVLGWREFDRSQYRIAEDFSRTLYTTLPPGAHLSASDDNILFVLIYLQLVEGVRPDVNLILQGVGQALPPLKFNPDREPLFFTHHPNWNVTSLDVVPVGMVYQAIRSGGTIPEPVVPKLELEGENDARVPKDYLTQNLIGYFHFMLGTTFERRDWIAASSQYRIAEASAPENDVLFYSLGVIYRRNGLFSEALAFFEKSHHINPRRIASQQRFRASDRIEEVRSEIRRLHSIEKPLSDTLSTRGVAPGTVDFHQFMASALEARDEHVAARGHRLRALMKQPISE
jgi:hypothetical protein